MKVTLIRHTSVDVPKGVCYGFTDVPLNTSFPTEAAQTAQKLAGLTFDAVFSSPLTRARRLAAFCGYADATLDDRLKEMNFGDWEMQKFDEINDPHLQVWYNDYLHERTRNGESFTDQYLRVAHFLTEMKERGYQHIALFAHGGVLVSAQVYAGTVKEEEAFSALTPYGGVICIEI